jgi:hypothetical protein
MAIRRMRSEGVVYGWINGDELHDGCAAFKRGAFGVFIGWAVGNLGGYDLGTWGTAFRKEYLLQSSMAVHAMCSLFGGVSRYQCQAISHGRLSHAVHVKIKRE